MDRCSCDATDVFELDSGLPQPSRFASQFPAFVLVIETHTITLEDWVQFRSYSLLRLPSWRALKKSNHESGLRTVGFSVIVSLEKEAFTVLPGTLRGGMASVAL